MKDKTVAITGANGFVGSNLVRTYDQKGYDVKPLVRKNSNKYLLPAGPEHIEIDYSSGESIHAALQGSNVLVHNAAITRGRNWGDFVKYNLDLTEKLINQVNVNGTIEHFIFISSQAAAGSCASPRTEADECYPVSYYGKSKLLAERLVAAKCQKNWTIVRPCSVYGEGDKDFFEYFKLVEKRLSILVGLRQRYISLIHVGQLCEVIANITLESNAYGEVFFASDGICYSWVDFITALEEVVGKKTLKIKIPSLMVLPVAAAGEIINLLTGKVPLINWQKSKEIRACHWICDSSKIRGIVPQYNQEQTLKKGLKQTYKWYKDNKWL